MSRHVNKGDATDNTVPLNVQFEPIVENWQHHYMEGQPVWFKRTHSVPGTISSIRTVAAYQVQVLNYLFASARRLLNGQLDENTSSSRKRQRCDRTAIPMNCDVPAVEFTEVFGTTVPLTPRACDAIFSFAGIIAINGSEQPARLPERASRATYMMSNVRAQGIYDRIVNYWGSLKEGTRIGFTAKMVDLSTSAYRRPDGQVITHEGTTGLTLQLVPMIVDNGLQPDRLRLNTEKTVCQRMNYVTDRLDHPELIDWKTPNDMIEPSIVQVDNTVVFGKFYQVGKVYIAVKDDSSKSTVADRLTRLIVPDEKSRVMITIQHSSRYLPM